ncbi:MAG: RNA methyltransferase [bacterium]
MINSNKQYLYSKTLVLEFLSSEKSNQAVKLYINPLKKSNLSHIIKLAKQKNIPIITTNFVKFKNQIEDYENIPVVLEISSFKYHTLEDILDNKTTLNVVVLAYKVKDPRNLGAIIRNCSAFDVKGLLITSKDSCPVNNTVINASRNSPLLIARINNCLSIIKLLQNKGYECFCLDIKGQIDIQNLKPPKNSKILLVLGGEKGLDNSIKQNCKTIRIPIKNIESLNTSVALGIFLYHLSII